MKKTQGFTVIELLASVVFITVAATEITSPSQTTEPTKIYKSVDQFVTKYNLVVMRKKCNPDLDKDGRGSCTITLADTEKIYLNCPVNTSNATLACQEITEDEYLLLERSPQ